MAARAVNLQIRPATRADEEFILGLVPRFVEFPLPADRDPDVLAARFARDIKNGIASGNPVFIAADTDSERPLGFIHLHTEDDLSGTTRAHVGDLAVAAGEDGNGVGRALMEFADRWAVEGGFDRIGLTAIATNDRALRFYEKLGYERDTVTLVKRP